VARYLSEAWFEEVAAATPTGTDGLTLQQVVTGTPDGEVRYHVGVSNGSAWVRAGQAEAPDATFTEDYSTAAAVARGELSVHTALLEGRIRVAGDMAVLSARQDELAGLDPVPWAVRAATTF
jgi:alkyl sulfatase BDS1-like metallo-beta-lactamase superfamily hydrolase